ncbi:hypothetical protein AWC29_06250 [Mycobacterium triplex]|uniref:Uncharacterized protein n=1 Tax=Mycobacterium triplex TaxID=47839 RepID=A0ABX3WCL3_9MYCO|nr:hypothetical protein AWC29_06250 [Mycobacterium triplex]
MIDPDSLDLRQQLAGWPPGVLPRRQTQPFGGYGCFSDGIRIPNLVIVFAVVSHLAAPAAFGKTSRGVVLLPPGRR